MRDGSKEVKQKLAEMGKYLGIPPKTAKTASDIAFDAYWDFRDDLAVTGKNIAELYKNSAAAVIGHPYILYDRFLNMNIGDRLAKMGYMPIPADFLQEEDTSDWHIYQRETEKKLAIAAKLRNMPHVKSVVLSYYACGSDAFSNAFYTQETGRNCYIMNLDEHTSDAGIQTRLEAFDALSPENTKHNAPPEIKELHRLKGKTLWLPATDFSSEILATAFNIFRINAKVIPQSPDSSFSLAKKYIQEDVCLPCIATLEDMLCRIGQKDFSPEKEAFFQASANGPCRLGMYPQRQKTAISQYAKHINPAIKDIPITVIDNNFFKAGLGLDFALLAWQGLYVHDLLRRMLHRARPYEKEKGEADRIYEKACWALVTNMLPVKKEIKKTGIKKYTGSHIFKNILSETKKEFENICDFSHPKPLIGLTGEFYIKLNAKANRNIVSYIEEKGFEVWQSPLTEYFDYSNYITEKLLTEKTATKNRYEKFLGKGELFIRRTAMKKITELETEYEKIPDSFCPRDCSTEEMTDLGSRFLSKAVTGEAICCLGKSSDFFLKNAQGIINIAPFGCMPGNITQMFSRPFRLAHENIPFLCLTYDGREDNYDRIDDFLANL